MIWGDVHKENREVGDNPASGSVLELKFHFHYYQAVSTDIKHRMKQE